MGDTAKRGLGEQAARITTERVHEEKMAQKISDYKDLHVYQNALQAAMEIFELTKRFPPEEKYSLVDQIRRSSRSVCANIAEAWRKRRYKAAFISKLNDAETEAGETQVWIEIAKRCHYIDKEVEEEFDGRYDQIIGQLIRMIEQPEKWLIRSK
jgi:four helix bundle protein